MPETDLQRALARLDDLEQRPDLKEAVVADILHDILKTAGYAAGVPEPFRPEIGIDFRLDALLEGRRERVGVEVRGHRGNVSGQTIYKVLDLIRKDVVDRVLIISLGGYSKLARERADLDLLGKVDLLDAKDLRDWLIRHAAAEEAAGTPIGTIMKAAMRALASRLAVAPDEIYEVEWREMERLLGEVFETLGFDTHVTRSAQDGGFDIRLKDKDSRVYLVEVKHWASPVGSRVVKRMIEVTTRESADLGLILGTGGFAPSVFDGLIELKSVPIHLGDHGKIAALCRAFYRAETQLWQADETLAELLLADTQVLPSPPKALIGA